MRKSTEWWSDLLIKDLAYDSADFRRRIFTGDDLVFVDDLDETFVLGERKDGNEIMLASYPLHDATTLGELQVFVLDRHDMVLDVDRHMSELRWSTWDRNSSAYEIRTVVDHKQLYRVRKATMEEKAEKLLS